MPKPPKPLQETSISVDDTTALCERAAIACGASEAVAASLARAAVDAEARGNRAVGLSHFTDYLEALKAGRIDGNAEPDITQPALALYLSDARGGAAHPGFDRVFPDIVKSAKLFGIALFTQKNAFTCGALGYFTGRLAEHGLVALAATNGPALLAGGGASRPVYCTNPFSFAVPAGEGPPLVIDQASSATAFVSIRQAAAEGRTIPEGWAIDAEGQPTTDPAAAMKGALLAFGGTRGANIALMVELLAAGLSGANWSLDAPGFTEGSESPGTGLTVIAIQPAFLAPDFEERVQAQLDRLSDGFGVHIPGRAGSAAAAAAREAGLSVPTELAERIASYLPID